MSSKILEVAASRKRMNLISGVVSGSEWVSSAISQLMKEEEVEELKKTLEEREQTLQKLKQSQEELQKSIAEVEHRHESQILHGKVVQQKAEREMKMLQEVEAETDRLKQERATLMKRKEEQQRQMETYSSYKDFLEEVCKISGHKDAEEFATYYHSMLSLKEKHVQQWKQRQEQKEQLKKELQILEQQQNLQWLQRTNKLAELETELKKAQSETLKWEGKWDHIQAMEAERAAELSRIRFSIQSIYEMCGHTIKDPNVDDTNKQLEEIKTFLQDDSDIMKPHQKSLQST